VAYFSSGARLPRWGKPARVEKEWDEEPTNGSSRVPLPKKYNEQTGNYYYGARYYDSKVSVWLSVDPMSSRDPGLTPYHFVYNNPFLFVDSNGLHGYKMDAN